MWGWARRTVSRQRMDRSVFKSLFLPYYDVAPSSPNCLPIPLAFSLLVMCPENIVAFVPPGLLHQILRNLGTTLLLHHAFRTHITPSECDIWPKHWPPLPLGSLQTSHPPSPGVLCCTDPFETSAHRSSTRYLTITHARFLIRLLVVRRSLLSHSFASVPLVLQRGSLVSHSLCSRTLPSSTTLPVSRLSLATCTVLVSDRPVQRGSGTSLLCPFLVPWVSSRCLRRLTAETSLQEEGSIWDGTYFIVQLADGPSVSPPVSSPPLRLPPTSTLSGSLRCGL
jgi:hypothetical protein